MYDSKNASQVMCGSVCFTRYVDSAEYNADTSELRDIDYYYKYCTGRSRALLFLRALTSLKNLHHFSNSSNNFKINAIWHR